MKDAPSIHKICVEKCAQKFIDSEPPEELLIDVMEYDQYMDAENMSEISRAHYFLVWKHMLKTLGPFKFSEFTLQQLLEFRNFCLTSFSYYTAFMRVAKVMAYLRWRNDGELPKEFRKFKMARPVSDRVNEKNVLTVQEIMRMINAAQCIRDKAIIYCLWESARRIEEFLRLKARDLKFVTTPKGEYAYYETYADKGRGVKRDVRTNFVVSYPALLEWLKTHPSIDLALMLRTDPKSEELKQIKTETHDPDAPIWCQFRFSHWKQKKCKGLPLNADDCWALLAKAKKGANISKPASAHRLRHSRITWMKRNNYSDDEIRIICGYTRFSRMPTYYSHISQEDVNKKQLTQHGLVATNDQSEVLPILHCPKCSAPNEKTSDFCQRCGEALNEMAKTESQRVVSQPNELLAELLKDPEFKEMMVKKLSELSTKAKIPMD